ncbi:hypothetical protein SKAU_G00346780 [Synaphobranchus kaupii]|uniref:Uncharacterized protein n=1 Tax=Synaphobranchus kaupii TaxID=118154 RepID=A0A9Q1EJV6_SYNKA|nr:hypothetical protein SKAU_G00346780 [Synaphobranchus kaupii]
MQTTAGKLTGRCDSCMTQKMRIFTFVQDQSEGQWGLYQAPVASWKQAFLRAPLLFSRKQLALTDGTRLSFSIQPLLKCCPWS